MIEHGMGKLPACLSCNRMKVEVRCVCVGGGGGVISVISLDILFRHQ